MRLRAERAVRSSRSIGTTASAAPEAATGDRRSTSCAVMPRDLKIDLFLRQQGLDSVFAEFERAMIQERVRAGLARARSEGKRLGRPPIAPALEKRIREALATPGRPGIRVIAERFGVNPSTVQRISRPFDGASVATQLNRPRYRAIATATRHAAACARPAHTSSGALEACPSRCQPAAPCCARSVAAGASNRRSRSNSTLQRRLLGRHA